MKKVFIILGVYAFLTAAYAASSPVVQVVSYKEPLGLYFSLQGWGSGTVIDNQGHIITNNHVVDNGVGGISDDFAICMTDNPSLPPRCHYTASVIDRDADADIAVLQLDATDIFGKRVDFSALSTLAIDMNYVPQSGDTVVARGYPWVGANTITETQGIVSGTAQYNENKYIKTDTLIAGGNSGGPLIRDGRMIGVNTFLIGGGYDPSLGYSLLISEANDFIQGALSSDKTLQSNNASFPQFLQKVETFSSQKKITDPLISLNLGEKYTILSYIPATSFSASLANADMTSVSSFNFFHIRTPRIRDLKELQKYLSYAMGAPNGTFRPVEIGGKTFYELIFNENPENEKIKNEHIYFMIVDETHLIFLYLQTPVPTKNTLEKIQTSIKDFLSNITFPSKFVFPKTQDIKIPGAAIGIKLLTDSSVSYDINEYEGVLSDFVVNKEDFVSARNYLGNFWSKAQIAVFKNSFETEDDTVDIWLKNVTEGMYAKPLVKKKVTYQGHEGFLVCSEDSIVDEIGKNNEIILCEAVFLVGDNHKYIISSQMILPKKQLRRIDTLMVQYLTKTLQVSDLGDTIFNTGNQTVLLPYSDVGGQSIAYQEALSSLISYGVLQSRPVFEGDAPLHWREYFSLYIWAVYHKKMTDKIDTKDTESPTFEKALSVLPVVQNDYAEDDVWQLEKINNLIRLLVAGESLPGYDLNTVYEFSDAVYSEEGVYKNIWNAIRAFESEYFAERVPMTPVKYISQKIVTYNPFTDLSIQSKESTGGVGFFRNNTQNKIDLEKVIYCDKSSLVYFSHECRTMRKESLLESLTYPVLTKGKALEVIMGYIDISLWTPSLTKAK